MVNPIPESVKKIWDNWNIRGVILFSLSLQTILILFAPLRKGTGNKLIISVIWSAYLLADWAANFAVGLIAENAKDTSEKKHKELLAFWAPFLLLHLGGPDTVTAFALEDNELWLRHLFGLIFQAVAAGYIFLLSLPGNQLLSPTILIFIAGIIKYVERTRALFLASLEKFRDSMLRKPDPGPNYAKFVETYVSNVQANIQTGISLVPEARFFYRDPGNIENKLDYLEVMHFASQYFNHFKGLIVDLISSFRQLYRTRASFTTEFSPEDALRIIEVELNFIYDVFHTKIQVTHSVLGIILRFTSFGSVLVALSIFYFRVEKNGFNEFDVGVTYALLLGATILDIIAFFVLVFSDETFVALRNGNSESRLGKTKSRIADALRWCLVLKSPRWQECRAQHSHREIKHEVLETPFMFRRWSGSVSGHSLIRYCLKARPSRVHNLACRNKVIKKLSIDIIFQIIARTTNKGMQFLQIYKIIGVLGFVIKKLLVLLGLAGIVDKIRIELYLSHEKFTKELWLLIYNEVKRKSLSAGSPEALRRICSAKGDWILQEWNGEVVLESYDIADVAYDERILLWHTATELLYYTTEEGADEITYNAREFSKLLSDYILYLLVSKPAIMDAVAVIAKIRLQDTCADAVRFFKEKGIKSNEVKKACESILKVDTSFPPRDVKGDKTKSVLFDASVLAKELQELEVGKKWKLVSQVWVELLSYAAFHCGPRTHAQQVSEGGELITFVWLLMAHFGLVEQFEDNKLDTRTEINGQMFTQITG
ncbi:hypothetical protein WN944_023574 [Citrus x changshan-huyou]|uniref:DUF4220 domain-containing protein n=1 Tax=Citrus x changshan-huyou TaxID=2935761 RepID=A0AAP0N3C3_9ROSI